MSDKIYPTWINDRLPREEDGDHASTVFVIRQNKAFSISSENVEKKEYWCCIPDNMKWGEGWPETIATPQECIDRAQGKELGTVQDEFYKLAYVADAKKIKELEERLKEEYAKVKELYEQIEGMRVTGCEMGIQNKALRKVLKELL